MSFQKVVKDNSEIRVNDVEIRLSEQPLLKSGVVSIQRLDHSTNNGFTATIEIKEMLGKGPRVLKWMQTPQYGTGRTSKRSN